MRLIASDRERPVLRFENLAPELQRYPSYLISWEGTCQGFALLAGVKGHVEFNVAPDLSWAEAKFFWA